MATGYANGLFRPGQDVTRGEFASFLYRAMDAEYEGDGSGFEDVPASSSHADAIAWLAAEGLSTGYSDGTFRPSRQISRGEVAVLLHRLELQRDAG